MSDWVDGTRGPFRPLASPHSPSHFPPTANVASYKHRLDRVTPFSGFLCLRIKTKTLPSTHRPWGLAAPPRPPPHPSELKVKPTGLPFPHRSLPPQPGSSHSASSCCWLTCSPAFLRQLSLCLGSLCPLPGWPPWPLCPLHLLYITPLQLRPASQPQGQRPGLVCLLVSPEGPWLVLNPHFLRV